MVLQGDWETRSLPEKWLGPQDTRVIGLSSSLAGSLLRREADEGVDPVRRQRD